MTETIYCLCKKKKKIGKYLPKVTKIKEKIQNSIIWNETKDLQILQMFKNIMQNIVKFLHIYNFRINGIIFEKL